LVLSAGFYSSIGIEELSNLALPLGSAGPQGGACLFCVIDRQAPGLSALFAFRVERGDFVDTFFGAGD
jgi:hypothetical protein